MEQNNQKRRNFILTLAQLAGAVGASVYAPQLAAKDSSAVVKSVSVSNGRNQQKVTIELDKSIEHKLFCLLYTSPSPRDGLLSRMPSSA